jgi:hypothetical protein
VPRRFPHFLRSLPLLPFLVAALSTVVPYLDRVGQLFYAPWAWLLDWLLYSALGTPRFIPNPRPLFLYIYFLWIPALLYSVCIEIILLAANYAKNRASRA